MMPTVVSSHVEESELGREYRSRFCGQVFRLWCC